ncbi:Hypp1442 [Branchiostoma lanceolatum]|uniref:Hypp1442 protein n=1 Tax=Branchiostoma lanceolatum TaxID=7740 RepID=A0A8J9ZJX1_BRALA|nr:Hypp1442 [Branchiostoma lanceolatum]
MAASRSFPFSLCGGKLQTDLATGKVAGRCLPYRTASPVAALLSPPSGRCENPARNVSLPVRMITPPRDSRPLRGAASRLPSSQMAPRPIRSPGSSR